MAAGYAIVGCREVSLLQSRTKPMKSSGADVLSIDAGKTLMIEGAAVIGAADEAGICVVGRSR